MAPGLGTSFGDHSSDVKYISSREARRRNPCSPVDLSPKKIARDRIAGQKFQISKSVLRPQFSLAEITR